MSDASHTLPPFNDVGLLPPGDYVLTFPQLLQSHLVSGEYSCHPQQWDASWRAQLVANAEVLVRQLWQVGVEEIYLAGSFVEDKPRPNDIDGYFICERRAFYTGRLRKALNAIDPKQAWGWHQRMHLNDEEKLAMWHAYRVELFPYTPGRRNTVVLNDGSEVEMSLPEFYRQSKRDLPRGIIHIKKEAGEFSGFFL